MAVSKPSSADQLINIQQLANEIQEQQSIKNKWEGKIKSLNSLGSGINPSKGGKFLNSIKSKYGKFASKIDKFNEKVSLKLNKYENKFKDSIAKASGKLHGWETGFNRKMSELSGSNSWIKSHIGSIGGKLGNLLVNKAGSGISNFFHNPCGAMNSLSFNSLTAMSFGGGINTSGFFNKVMSDVSCVGNMAHRAFEVAGKAVYGFRKVRQFFDESNSDKLKQLLSLNCIKNLSVAGISLGALTNCITHKVMTNFNPGQLPMASYNSVQGNLARTPCGVLLSQVPILSGIMQSITSGIIMGEMIKNDFNTFNAYINNSMNNTVQQAMTLGGIKHMYDGDDTINKITATSNIFNMPQMSTANPLDYNFNGARILNSLQTYHNSIVNQQNSGLNNNSSLTNNAKALYNDIINIMDKIYPTWGEKGYNHVGGNIPLGNITKSVIQGTSSNSEYNPNDTDPFTINLSGTVTTNLSQVMEINIWTQIQPTTVQQEILNVQNTYTPNFSYTSCSSCS